MSLTFKMLPREPEPIFSSASRISGWKIIKIAIIPILNISEKIKFVACKSKIEDRKVKTKQIKIPIRSAPAFLPRMNL